MVEASRIIVADVLEGLASIDAGSVHCCVTSPPYWGLRDYGVDGQIGLEATPDEFVARMVEVFRAVRRVLRDDGTLWLNLGDCYNSGGRGGNPNGPTSTLQGGRDNQEASRVKRYARKPSSTATHGGWTETENGAARVVCPSFKPKDLCMMPWRVALALQGDGWWLRSVIAWAKKSPMPESVTDRPTSSWEPIFLLTKSARYFYDAEAVKEPLNTSGVPNAPGKHAGSNGNPTSYSGDRPEWPAGRNMRNVWHLGPEPYPEAHFATFPTEIPRRAIKAGTSERGCCPGCAARRGGGWLMVAASTSAATTITATTSAAARARTRRASSTAATTTRPGRLSRHARWHGSPRARATPASPCPVSCSTPSSDPAQPSPSRESSAGTASGSS